MAAGDRSAVDDHRRHRNAVAGRGRLGRGRQPTRPFLVSVLSHPGASRAGAKRPPQRSSQRGRWVFSSVRWSGSRDSFPVIHFALTRLGFATPVLAPLQEILALVLLILSRGHGRHLRQTDAFGEPSPGSRAPSSQEKIEHLAYHDDLTGLPNRRLLCRHRMTQALSRDDVTTGTLRFSLSMSTTSRPSTTPLATRPRDSILCQWPLIRGRRSVKTGHRCTPGRR